MKKEFIGKKICFLGASNLSNGLYVYNIRSYMHNQKDRCYVFNRGTGGNRMDMAFDIIQEEIVDLKPDYCVFSYGVNDMGVWLYDSFKEETPELLAERKIRDDNFYNGARYIVKTCKENGIIPIPMTVNPVDQKLEEKPDIPTLGDNKEKAQLLGPWFYKRKTFEKINEKVEIYNAFLKQLAEDEGVPFFETYSKIYDLMINETEGIYASDGIHITEKGNCFVAKAILENFGYQNVSTEFSHDEQNDEIKRVEAIERSARFLRNNMFNAVFGNFTEQDIEKEAQKILDDENQPTWMKNSAKNYTNNYKNRFELRDKVIELTLKY